MNNDVALLPSIFPEAKSENTMIVVKQRVSGGGFLAMMVDKIMELQTDGGTQCFPRYLYVPVTKTLEGPTGVKPQRHLFKEDDDLFEAAERVEFTRVDAITREGLASFTSAYPGETITNDDVFFYVYGLLHSESYLSRFADSLTKDLPHIPAVRKFDDFRAFSKAGRNLSDLHIGFEAAESFPVTLVLAKPMKDFAAADYRVTQMRFGKGADGERHDRTTVVYNHNVTIKDVPLKAYRYVVNGKAALEWVMERQAVTTHKESGIVNDANDWATETMDNPAYPLELFQRVITVSLETMKIVDALPALDL